MKSERRFTSASTLREAAAAGARPQSGKNIAHECGTSSHAAEWRVRSTTPRGPAIARGASVSADDWRVLTTARPNTLLEGPTPKTNAVIRALSAHFESPVCVWEGSLPCARPGTLVIRDVSRLSIADQRALEAWLVAPGAVRVLATRSRRLFPLTERGLFLTDLYYRLNVFRVVLKHRRC